MNCESESVTMPSANTPAVCVTVTVPPRISAWRARPRVPARYAATIVLPCPGVSAWNMPNTSARPSAASAPKTLRSPPFSISETKPPSSLAELEAVSGATSSRAGIACTARPPEPSAATVVSERMSGGECSRSVG